MICSGCGEIEQTPQWLGDGPVSFVCAKCAQPPILSIATPSGRTVIRKADGSLWCSINEDEYRSLLSRNKPGPPMGGRWTWNPQNHPTKRALSEDSPDGEMVVPDFVENRLIPPTEDSYGPVLKGVLDVPGGMLSIEARWHVHAVFGIDEVYQMVGKIVEPFNSCLKGGHYYATFAPASGKFQVCMRVNSNAEVKSTGTPSVALTREQMLGVPEHVVDCDEPTIVEQKGS